MIYASIMTGDISKGTEIFQLVRYNYSVNLFTPQDTSKSKRWASFHLRKFLSLLAHKEKLRGKENICN
jgi:hypothetical protein